MARMPRTPDAVLDLADAILEGDRHSLSKGITLIESAQPKHQELANLLLIRVLRQTNRRRREQFRRHAALSEFQSFRVGISGPPGAGKSHFIEKFGSYLLSDEARQHADELRVSASTGKLSDDVKRKVVPTLPSKIAVLTIDPSSSRSGGSILGDKTRMQQLSHHPNAFVRPSATWGTLGGLTRATSEAMVLCEGAGFDLILVETVGVGQSEVKVAETVDMTMLVVPPAAGDELQGLKKGIVEIADAVMVSKSDGALLPSARATRVNYMHALQLNRPRYDFWQPPVLNCSILEDPLHPKYGVARVWQKMNEFKLALIEHDEFKSVRRRQRVIAAQNQVQQEILSRVDADPRMRQLGEDLVHQLSTGTITPRYAAYHLVDEFLASRHAPVHHESEETIVRTVRKELEREREESAKEHRHMLDDQH